MIHNDPYRAQLTLDTAQGSLRVTGVRGEVMWSAALMAEQGSRRNSARTLTLPELYRDVGV